MISTMLCFGVYNIRITAGVLYTRHDVSLVNMRFSFVHQFSDLVPLVKMPPPLIE